MENRDIADNQITASSTYDVDHAANQGRLNFKKTLGKAGSWSAGANNVHQWLQVALGKNLTKITFVATQGRHNFSQWVEKYKLQYSNDGANFQFYRERRQVTDKVKRTLNLF